MPRGSRLTEAGAWYHVMNRGHSRKYIFLKDSDYTYFLKLLGDVSDEFGVEIHAYCLMGNHYHLLIKTPVDNLSEAIKQLNFRYSTYFNKRRNRDGFLFRGRFKSIIIRTDAYLMNVSRYIHLNPKEAGLVNLPEAYRWSSYQSYVRSEKSCAWVYTDFLSSMAGDYCDYVDSGIPQKIRDIYNKARLPSELK